MSFLSDFSLDLLEICKSPEEAVVVVEEEDDDEDDDESEEEIGNAEAEEDKELEI